MKELAVISGKGGTGKTSLVASFAALAERVVVADCDVDAADLHLLLTPRTTETHDYWHGRQAVINAQVCAGCGGCQAVCRFAAVHADGPPNTFTKRTFRIDPLACEGCGACLEVCLPQAVAFPERHAGQWFVADTRFGPMVHARLGLGGENSGKLVSQVRQKAHELARAGGYDLVLIDGSPGIGCPVIASVARADLVLVVTEPTPAGRHDLERVLQLTRHFKIPTAVCVNRWDLSPEMTTQSEHLAKDSGASCVGRIRLDPVFNQAQRQARTVVELGSTDAADDLRRVWNLVQGRLLNQSTKEKQ